MEIASVSPVSWTGDMYYYMLKGVSGVVCLIGNGELEDAIVEGKISATNHYIKVNGNHLNSVRMSLETENPTRQMDSLISFFLLAHTKPKSK